MSYINCSVEYLRDLAIQLSREIDEYSTEAVQRSLVSSMVLWHRYHYVIPKMKQELEYINKLIDIKTGNRRTLHGTGKRITELRKTLGDA